MTSEVKSFQDISRAVAKRFIQTVVMVDDQAFRRQELEQPEPIREPLGPFGEPVSAETSGSEEAVSDATTLNPTTQNENLDAKELIHLFASNGLVCSVIEPDQSGEPSTSEAVQVARRADVLVLDWQIRKDEGETAKGILREVLGEDLRRGGRLRLVAFYTGSLNFSEIQKSLKSLMEEANLKVDVDAEQLALSGKHVRIVVLAKQPDRQLQHFKVDHVGIKHLPDRLIAEFSRLTAGLVSNVALEGFSVLRDTTHAVLANLHDGLDPAYLTHRALQQRPDDAIDHAIDLVASEITALLHGFEIGNVSNFEAVAAWLKPRNLRSLETGKKTLACKPEDIERLLKDGFATWKTAGIGSQTGDAKAFSKSLTRTFSSTSNKNSDAELAISISTIRRYGDNQPPPRLTLGTVLGERQLQDTPSQYWICIQPRCDSVRIPPTGRTFLLAPIHIAKDNKVDLVLDVDGKQLELSISERPYEIKTVVFTPKSGYDVIRSARMSGRYIFEQSNSAQEFVWVAQLKEAHAQRILNRFAAKLARVGLNESEWLRLQQGKE